MKPYVQKTVDNFWEFIFPSEIENEKIYTEFYDAVELLEYDDYQAETVFKSLISRFPYYLDAYNLLSIIAFRNQKKYFESYLTAEKAYLLGKDFIPKEFNFKKDKLIWSNLNNRPYLRTCQTYGLECQYKGEYNKAISLYSEALLLNEQDNQGLRYLYLECLFALKDYKSAKVLIKKHSDDYSIEFIYGQISAEVLLGNTSLPKELLNKAIKVNSYLPAEIIKNKHIKPPPFRLPGEPNFDAGIPVGSVQEAYDYWSRNKGVYKNKLIISFYRQYFN